MKKITQLSILVACAMFTMGGCETVKEHVTPENARIAAALVCSNTLNLAVKDADRVETANYIYSVARAVRSLSGGKVPTRAELETAIDIFTPAGGKWVNLGTNISSIWGAFYPQVQGNPAKALDYLEAIAAGCEDAARPYITPVPVGTPRPIDTPPPDP